MGKIRAVLVFAGVTILLLPFQNCGKGFDSTSFDSKNEPLCKAARKAEALQLSWSEKSLGCGDLTNYECERRIFSPDLATMSHQLKECLPGGETCVDVLVFQFNTSEALRANPDPKEFLVGGSYNHEEIRCQHRLIYRGTRIFEAEGPSLEEALAKVIKACEQATSSEN